MSGAGNRIRRTKKIGSWIALLSLLLSTLGVTLATIIPNGASATLVGSPFNGADAVPDIAGTPDPIHGADTTNYSGGAKEKDVCPGVGTGTAPNKDDLD